MYTQCDGGRFDCVCMALCMCVCFPVWFFVSHIIIQLHMLHYFTATRWARELALTFITLTLARCAPLWRFDYELVLSMVSICFFAMAFDCMVFVAQDFFSNSSARNHAAVVMVVVFDGVKMMTMVVVMMLGATYSRCGNVVAEVTTDLCFCCCYNYILHICVNVCVREYFFATIFLFLIIVSWQWRREWSATTRE